LKAPRGPQKGLDLKVIGDLAESGRIDSREQEHGPRFNYERHSRSRWDFVAQRFAHGIVEDLLKTLPAHSNPLPQHLFHVRIKSNGGSHGDSMTAESSAVNMPRTPP
jgi:hypothetical protein